MLVTFIGRSKTVSRAGILEELSDQSGLFILTGKLTVWAVGSRLVLI